MGTFEYPEEVVYARVESARKRDVRFAELEAQNTDLLEALRMADRLLGQVIGEGWPEWGEAKSIREALAKASA